MAESSRRSGVRVSAQPYQRHVTSSRTQNRTVPMSGFVESSLTRVATVEKVNTEGAVGAER
jgi:hypothetical protein